MIHLSQVIGILCNNDYSVEFDPCDGNFLCTIRWFDPASNLSICEAQQKGVTPNVALVDCLKNHRSDRLTKLINQHAVLKEELCNSSTNLAGATVK